MSPCKGASPAMFSCGMVWTVPPISASTIATSNAAPIGSRCSTATSATESSCMPPLRSRDRAPTCRATTGSRFNFTTRNSENTPARATVPVNLSVVSHRGKLFVTGFYKKQRVGKLWVKAFMDGAQYQRAVHDRGKDKMELAHVNTYVHAGKIRYCAVFYGNINRSQISPPRAHRRGLQSRARDLCRQGLRIEGRHRGRTQRISPLHCSVAKVRWPGNDGGPARASSVGRTPVSGEGARPSPLPLFLIRAGRCILGQPRASEPPLPWLLPPLEPGTRPVFGIADAAPARGLLGCHLQGEQLGEASRQIGRNRDSLHRSLVQQAPLAPPLTSAGNLHPMQDDITWNWRLKAEPAPGRRCPHLLSALFRKIHCHPQAVERARQHSMNEAVGFDGTHPGKRVTSRHREGIGEVVLVKNRPPAGPAPDVIEPRLPAEDCLNLGDGLENSRRKPWA